MTQYRPVPKSAIDLMHPFEGLRLVAYDDKQPNRKKWSSPAQVIGVPTIGYGHTGPDVTKSDVVSGKRISMAEAERLFRADLIDAQSKIYRFVKASRINALSEFQYAALIAFVYNAGLSPKWTITKLLNAGRFNEVPDQMIRFVNSGGVRMQGLVNRRRAEIDLWRSTGTAAMPHPGLEYANSATLVEAAAAQTLAMSRTIAANVTAGLGGVTSAASIAIAQVAPHASASPLLNTVLVTAVIVSTVGAFLGAMFRAQDAAAAKA